MLTSTSQIVILNHRQKTQHRSDTNQGPKQTVVIQGSRILSQVIPSGSLHAFPKTGTSQPQSAQVELIYPDLIS